MKLYFSRRHSIFTALVAFYLIPLLFFVYYSIGLMPKQKSWSILSFGLLLVGAGTLFLMLCLYYWEQTLQNLENDPLERIKQLAFSPIKDHETKVTSLDPVLTLSKLHEESSNEATKELNLVQTSLKEIQDRNEKLNELLEEKTQALQKIEEENRFNETKFHQITQDFADYKLFSEEQLKQKQLQLASLQQIIEDQRAEVEKRQDQIHQLDTKVHDLSYEIKTLLYLHEEEAAPSKPSKLLKQEELFSSEKKDLAIEETLVVDEAAIPSSENSIQTPSDAVELLKKCISIAQKLTGANYYSNEASRYREFSSSHYAIDQRRLFDSLRSETSALIVVYSQKENRLLFANHQVKSLLGWSPEKFTADFSLVLQDGMLEWKKAIAGLANTQDSQVHLLMKTKNGQELLLNCHLGLVPGGLFRNYVIGVLYPA